MYTYEHGGRAAFEQGGENMLDLSANINPLGMPDGVADAITNEIANVTRYPDSLSYSLRQSIGNYERVDKEHIFCGNGASDIIFRLPVCIKPKTALIPAPTFSDYERALKSFGALINYHYLDESGGFKLTESFTAEVIKQKPDILYICNPNNPTGVITPKSVMQTVLEASKKIGATVIIDECFLDFTEFSETHTAKHYLSEYGNIVILKAFTKIFALPGIRLGYCICSDTSIINKLYENGADWPVSNLAQGAGEAAIKSSSEYIKETVSYTARQRSFIKEQLTLLGYTVFDSAANYVFFKDLYKRDLIALLKKHNICIRNCSNYAGLKQGFWRVAVSTKDNNERFISAMKVIGMATN